MLLVLYSLVMLGVFLIQTHPFFLKIGPGGHVDLTLLVVVAFCLLWGGRRALLLSFITGLAYDLISSDLLGFNAFSKTITAFAVLAITHRVQPHGRVTQGLLAAFAIGLDTLMRLLALAVLHARLYPLWPTLKTLAPHLLLSLALFPLVLVGLQALARLMRVQPDKGPRHAAIF